MMDIGKDLREAYEQGYKDRDAELVRCKECEIKAYAEKLVDAFIEDGEELAESSEAVHIHNDGTLEVKVPNAQKVGRVLIMDTDSHIGGGLFYPDEAVADRSIGKRIDTTGESL